MLVKTFGAALQGIDAIPVMIEASARSGMSFTLVGLPDTAVKESYERVMSATRETGFDIRRYSIIVNLAPADIRKEGAAYDLPIAMAVLRACEVIDPIDLEQSMIMGELSLDGSVLPIRGALPMAICAREMGYKEIFVPKANVTEAAVVNNIKVYGVETLRQLVDHLSGVAPIEPTVIDTRAEFARAELQYEYDFADVRGQENVKRAFEIACAGGHNILLVGPPGSGKSMMAKRLPSILPPLTLSEALETTKIHSVAGTLRRGSMLMTHRPFRSPHHTVSPTAMVGGGTNPRPGEISLAHNGVLFLDEFPEFPRSVLEVLRQPLEDRRISVSRVRYSNEYPASFMLVASMNPCPCGYYTHPTRECTCSPSTINRYLNRISGPLLDRIDLHVEILPVPFEKLSSLQTGETSADIRRRVAAARSIQLERFADDPTVHCNAQMTSKQMQKYCRPTPEAMDVLESAIRKFDMSARAYDRILKVARTIADLAGSEEIGVDHMMEACSYRNLDRSSWRNVQTF